MKEMGMSCSMFWRYKKDIQNLKLENFKEWQICKTIRTWDQLILQKGYEVVSPVSG